MLVYFLCEEKPIDKPVEKFDIMPKAGDEVELGSGVYLIQPNPIRWIVRESPFGYVHVPRLVVTEIKPVVVAPSFPTPIIPDDAPFVASDPLPPVKRSKKSTMKG